MQQDRRLRRPTSNPRAVMVAALATLLGARCGGNSDKFLAGDSGPEPSNDSAAALFASDGSDGGHDAPDGGTAGTGTAQSPDGETATSRSGGPSPEGGTSSSGGSDSLGAGGSKGSGGAIGSGGAAQTDTAPDSGSLNSGGSPNSGGSRPTDGEGGAGDARGGAPSTGGTPNAGGAAGSGGAAAADGGGGAAGGDSPFCKPHTVIDDMEDGDGAICPNDGRKGGWFTLEGSAATVSPTPNTFLNAALIPGGRGTSTYAMHATGSALTTSDDGNCWAMLAASLSDDGPYDLSSYTGISFWARSATNLRLRVSFSNTASRTIANGGTCNESYGGCADDYGKTIDVTPSWQQYTIVFQYTKPLGWGQEVARDFAHTWIVQFLYNRWPYQEPVPNPDSFDFWIDDLAVY